MHIYIGADHNGFALKSELTSWLKKANYEVFDEGNSTLQPDDDFPQYAAKVASAVLTSDDPDARGILLCGSGQGVCMAANRFKGIRASLCWDAASARVSRNDDDANILCLPARLLASGGAETILRVWLSTPFAEASRFVRRIKELDDLNR
jgi:ribose 5-phosphate isomerase B